MVCCKRPLRRKPDLTYQKRFLLLLWLLLAEQRILLHLLGLVNLLLIVNQTIFAFFWMKGLHCEQDIIVLTHFPYP